jgi:hemerythrin superfamily protein
MNIYQYLKKDHQKVADLMEQVVSASDAAKRETLFEQIKNELTLHADAEEVTFYKALDDATQSKKVEEKVEHAHEEHDEVREYLEKLESLNAKDSEWLVTFGEFKHAVTHHVEEEEEEIFEKAKQYLSKKQETDLAKEMDALKQERMKELASAA